MRLIGVASSPRQLKKLIRAYKEIEYPENLNEIPSEEINKHLTYGYVETVTLNTLL